MLLSMDNCRNAAMSKRFSKKKTLTKVKKKSINHEEYSCISPALLVLNSDKK